jgi:phosphohistidine phosphatase
MKRLILTRHAKSGWDNLELADYERPLNDRGREACKLIGDWLLSKDYIPEQVLASTATRCMQTWEGIGMTMGCDAPVTYESGLYHSSPEMILKFLRGATAETVLLTAHNPGIGEFAHRICKTPPTHDRFFGYPSAATTVVDFDVKKWADISMGSGQCLDFVIPSELK